MPTLKYFSGKGTPRQYSVHKPVTTVGKAPGNDVVTAVYIADTVSREAGLVSTCAEEPEPEPLALGALPGFHEAPLDRMREQLAHAGSHGRSLNAHAIPNARHAEKDTGNALGPLHIVAPLMHGGRVASQGIGLALQRGIDRLRRLDPAVHAVANALRRERIHDRRRFSHHDGSLRMQRAVAIPQLERRVGNLGLVPVNPKALGIRLQRFSIIGRSLAQK